MGQQSSNEVRTDLVTASHVEQGLALSMQQGVNPALQFMEQRGVPRPVALRVLCSPEHFRKRDRRTMPRPR